MRKLRDIAAEAIAERGIDPGAETVEPPAFDPVAHRIDSATMALGMVVPNRFAHAEIDDRNVRVWTDAFLANRVTCRSLLLSGTPGTGKTHAAFAALRRIVLACAERNERITYRIVTHPDFNHTMRPKSDESHEYALDSLLAADLLVFDDLGAGKQTEWTADSLHRLVDRRWSDQLPTIFTTNIDPDELTAAVGERTVSRVFDSVRVSLAGTDRRRADPA